MQSTYISFDEVADYIFAYYMFFFWISILHFAHCNSRAFADKPSLTCAYKLHATPTDLSLSLSHSTRSLMSTSKIFLVVHIRLMWLQQQMAGDGESMQTLVIEWTSTSKSSLCRQFACSWKFQTHFRWWMELTPHAMMTNISNKRWFNLVHVERRLPLEQHH